MNRRPFQTQIFLLALALSLSARAQATEDELFQAARTGDAAAVTALVESGIAVDTTNTYGSTALAMAASNGQLEVVAKLLELGADPNIAETFYGSRPLDQALFFAERRDIAALLLRAGAEDRDQALEFAVGDGDLELAKAAIEGGPITASRLEAIRSREDTLTPELVKLLDDATRRPDPEPPVYSAAELEEFSGIFEAFAGDTRAEVELREGRLWLLLDQRTAAFETIGDKRFRAALPAGDATREAETVTASFFGRAGTIEGIALERGDGGRPESLRRSVAEPAGDVAYEAPTEPAATKRTVHWPSFRGERASGIGDGDSTPIDWNLETGDNVLWSMPVSGLGNSSPIVWGDKVFLTTATAEDVEQTIRTGLTGEGTPVSEEVEHSWRVLAFDKRTGKTLWDKEIGHAVPLTRRHFKATQANSTAATDGKHIVAVFPTAGLATLTMDGDLLWKKQLGGLNAGAFSDPGIEWGYASSPVIFEDLVILQVDIHEGGYLSAWELETGELVWRTERDVAPSWATPTIVDGPKGPELIVNGSRIAGYNPRTGEELWSLGPNSELVIATPIAGDGVVYVSAGYPPIKPIYAVELGTRGAIEATPGTDHPALRWSHNLGGAYMPTPLLYRGLFFVIHHNGIFVTYDAETGAALSKSRFSQRGTFTGSPVAANGYLYAGTEEGLLYILKAGPEYEEVAVHDFAEPLMATPAVSEGIVLVRTPSKLVALAAEKRTLDTH